ncbi:MAG: thiamine diphosphokinase [Bacteroidales bacterium]|nr:thiamine diphosphokinase [Bacteroidales bacterium]
MHRNVVIVCNGDFPRTEYPRYLLREADFIIVCDGALSKYLRNMKAVFSKERLPDLVIGDMDSLSKSMQEKYKDLIVKVEEQDYNDQTKAFRWVMENLGEASLIRIVGATGQREDHTIGNMSLLMEYTRMFDLKDRIVEMVTDHGTVFAATDTLEMECGTGRKVSIFSPDNSLKIKSSGLQWQTGDVVFDNWWKATLNRAVDDKVRLEFSHKSLALIMID